MNFNREAPPMVRALLTEAGRGSPTKATMPQR